MSHTKETKAMQMRTEREYLVTGDWLQGWPCKVVIRRYDPVNGKPPWGEVWVEWDHEPKQLAARLPTDLMREILRLFDEGGR